MIRVFLILTVLSALLLAACSNPGVSAQAPQGFPPLMVRAVTVTKGDVPLEITAIGNVEAISSVDVKARVTAPVLNVAFTEGQDVQKGQLLFELDPETWTRQAAEIEANIVRDTANEKQAQANIVKDEVTLKNAQSIAERGAQLLKEGIFSREQTDQVVSNADAARAALDADRAALDSARAAGKADTAKLAQTRLQLEYTKIDAPISGRAGTIAVKPGNIAKENDTTLVSLLQMSPIYVSFSVPEDLLDEVRNYNRSHALEVFAITSEGRQSAGALRFIDNSVDTTTGMIKMKAEFPNAERTLWPGLFVNVRARLRLEKDRVLAPVQAVQTGPQGKYVWVLNPDNSTVSMREIQVLRNFTPPGKAEQAVVASGLNAGDRVISEGQMRLSPGAPVRLLQPNQAPGA